MPEADQNSGRFVLLCGAAVSLLVAIAGYFTGGESASTLSAATSPPTLESGNIELPASNNAGEKIAASASLHREKYESGATASFAEPSVSGLEEQASQRDQRAVSKIVETLREVAASYDPKRLSELDTHLYSSNPVIRAEAVDAVLNLGDASGAEMLRRASRSMLDPKEELETLGKAAFLRLPSGSLKAASVPK